jgi:Flp pilus assembly protein TadD
MESLVSQSNSPLPLDRMLLASLCELEGKTAAAEEQYQELVRDQNAPAGNLEYYISFLLRQARAQDAEPLVERLLRLTESSAPAERARGLLLQARCLKMRKREAEIRPLIQKFVDAHQSQLTEERQKAQFSDLIGRIYDALQMYDEAVAWRRQLVSMLPDAYPLLVRELCLAGKHGAAVDVVLKNLKDQESPPFTLMIASVLSTGSAPDAVLAECEPMLAKGAQQHADNADVLYALATVRAMQGRNQDAISLLERADRARSGDVATLNNLATLLAETPGREQEALGRINQAIEIVGEQPFLIDTKGTILALTGATSEAIELLTSLVLMPNADPRFNLHLALAYDRDGQVKEAQSQYQNALKNDVQTQALTRGDKELLDKFRQKYGAGTSQSRVFPRRFFIRPSATISPGVEIVQFLGHCSSRIFTYRSNVRCGLSGLCASAGNKEISRRGAEGAEDRQPEWAISFSHVVPTVCLARS